MRIALEEDFPSCEGGWSVPVVLDDDLPGGCGCGGACCCGDGDDAQEPGLPLPTLTVRERIRDGADFTGTPQLTWRTAGSGPAITYEQRRETNDGGGQTLVTATAVLGWVEDEPAPKETAVVWDSDGHRWQLTSVRALPGRLELAMQRVEDSDRPADPVG